MLYYVCLAQFIFANPNYLNSNGSHRSLSNDVLAILSNNWNVRDGQVVPFSDQVTLAGGAVRLEATMLYADLADSTQLAMNYDRRVAAKVFKSFSHLRFQNYSRPRRRNTLV